MPPNDYIRLIRFKIYHVLLFKSSFQSVSVCTCATTGTELNNHPEKGIFRLRINKELNQTTDFENFSEIDGYANYNRISQFKVEDKILFATPKGIYV